VVDVQQNPNRAHRTRVRDVDGGDGNHAWGSGDGDGGLLWGVDPGGFLEHRGKIDQRSYDAGTPVKGGEFVPGVTVEIDADLRDDGVVARRVKILPGEADPEIEALFPELQRVIVKITTTDGQEFSKQIDYPKGDPRNPLTDQEVEEKFDALAEPVLAAAAREQVKQTVWKLDELSSITELMQQLS
jgi:hypothetical protein